MFSSNRRRKLFIEPKVQGSLLFRVASYWIAMVWAAAVLLVGAPYAIGVALSQNPPEFLEVLARVFAQMWPALFVAAMMLPLVLLDVLRQSHRIVGPTLRIRRALMDLADGKTIQPIYLRKGDYWAEAAEAINRIQENLLAAAVPCPPVRCDLKTSGPDPSTTLVLPVPRRAKDAFDESVLDDFGPEIDGDEDRATIVLSELRSLQLDSESAPLGETMAFPSRQDGGDLADPIDDSDVEFGDSAEEVAATIVFGRETSDFQAAERGDD